MQQLDAGACREHFHRDMQRAVGPRRAVGNFARALPGIVDKILQRLPRRRGRHRQHGGIGQHPCHRCELRHFISHRTIEQPIRLRQHSQRRQCHQQRIAVRFGARRLGVADGSTGAAGAVVHHHRLAQDALQRQRHRPRREIGLAAGRERHDHGDGTRGPGALRERRHIQ